MTDVLAYRRGVSLDYDPAQGVPVGLIVHAHGGSFLTGTRDDRLARWLRLIMPQQGFAVASIDYRKGGRPLAAFGDDLHPQITGA